MATIEVKDQQVLIKELTIEDRALADLLSRQAPEYREELARRALMVGARGLVSMGVGVDLAELDDRVRRSLAEATGEVSRHVEAVMTAAHQAMDRNLDPDHRASLLGRAIAQFTEWRTGFLQQVDPDRAGTPTARLLERLSELVGPSLEARLEAALDPEADGSALSRLSDIIHQRLDDLRDLIIEGRGRQLEAQRGTAKGVDFEDRVEDILRTWARSVGALVERTSRQAGDLSGDSLVGDLVVELASGARVVVEAKNCLSISLNGVDGILPELDRAMQNRRAQTAICVSALDAFPHEVGNFGVYGHRVLVVDDGEGTLMSAALRWAMASTGADAAMRVEADPAVVIDRLNRLRGLGQLFSTQRRALTEVSTSVGKVQQGLEQVRAELLSLVDDLVAELARGKAAGKLVELRREAG